MRVVHTAKAVFSGCAFLCAVLSPHTLLAQTQLESMLAYSDTGFSKKVEQRAIEPAEVLRTVAPRYPKLAYRKEVEGWVEVSYRINQSGKPVNVGVKRSEPAEVFDKAAVSAIAKWVFKPDTNTQTGKGVTSDIKTTRINFLMDL